VKTVTLIISLYVIFALPVLLIGITGIWSAGTFIFLGVTVLAVVFLIIFSARAAYLLKSLISSSSKKTISGKGGGIDLNKFVRKTVHTFMKVGTGLVFVFCILVVMIFASINRRFGLADAYWYERGRSHSAVLNDVCIACVSGGHSVVFTVLEVVLVICSCMLEVRMLSLPCNCGISLRRLCDQRQTDVASRGGKAQPQVSSGQLRATKKALVQCSAVSSAGKGSDTSDVAVASTAPSQAPAE
jgi:hypothetical protein